LDTRLADNEETKLSLQNDGGGSQFRALKTNVQQISDRNIHLQALER